MYICVLSSIAEENDPPYDPSPHLEGRQWRHHVVQPTDGEEQIKALMDDGVDVFLNLCDGTPDEPVSAIQLVKSMEKLGAAFTGADSSFFDPTRQEMKRAAARVGVPTPASTFVKSMADVERAARTLRFPMLVKPAHGYASFGIRKESRVTNAEDLKTQAAITMKDDGRALIEEFIEGREFTCLVAEDPDDPAHTISFKPVEFLFPQGESFKHYNLKWVDYNEMKVAVVTNPNYEKRLREYTVRVFQALKGNGYARCDFRLGADGEFYMLEINPNCGIFYPPADAGSADFCLLNDPVGHQGFMELVIRLALKRQAEALRITPQIVGKRELVKQEIAKPPARRQTVKRETTKRSV
ncbi:MAG TPA: ATP-grasp domain-containing protein [Anaerolineales bacterium]|nr:ATP-grasp domain-containing protein [Anaerolineales bacterium]